MSNIKLKEIKPGMVIHCSTEEEAKALFKHLDEVGYTWCGGEELDNEDTGYEENGEKTCYKIHEDDTITHCYKEYFLRQGSKITEFSDLIEPELTVEEVLRILSEATEFHCKNSICNECPFGYANNDAGVYLCGIKSFSGNEQRIIEICRQWKADHEKKEPEVEWHYTAEIHGKSFDSFKNCETKEEAIEFVEEELKKAGKDAWGKYEQICRVKAVN